MTLEQAVEAAQAAVDAQSAKVSESARTLVQAVGKALAAYATEEVKQLVGNQHEQTAKYQADGKLGQFKSEIMALVEKLPAEVDRTFAGGKHLVYAFQPSDEAVSALGRSGGGNKSYIRTGCSNALYEINALLKGWYPFAHRILFVGSQGLEFPVSFQQDISVGYQAYNTQQLELERLTGRLDKAEAELSKANAASAWDNA